QGLRGIQGMSAQTVPPLELRTWARRLPWGRWGLRGGAFVYLGGMIVLPLIAVIEKGFASGLLALRSALSLPGAGEAIRLTLVTAFITAVVNALFGTLLAYILVRWRFPGRGALGALV